MADLAALRAAVTNSEQRATAAAAGDEEEEEGHAALPKPQARELSSEEAAQVRLAVDSVKDLPRVTLCDGPNGRSIAFGTTRVNRDTFVTHWLAPVCALLGFSAPTTAAAAEDEDDEEGTRVNAAAVATTQESTKEDDVLRPREGHHGAAATNSQVTAEGIHYPVVSSKRRRTDAQANP